MSNVLKNWFGEEIPDIKDIHLVDEVREYDEKTMSWVLGELGISSPAGIVQDVMKIADKYGTFGNLSRLFRYEREAHGVLAEVGVTPARIAEKLSDRASIIFNEIKPCMESGTVLDLGCGDGKVGELASEQRGVVLSDIYEHSHIKGTGLDFVPISSQNSKVRLPDGEFDNTLLLTVMHHSTHPIHTLMEAKRMTRNGGRIIVIESVYGVDEDSGFGRLGHENQRLSNIFFDHFYNRCIHNSEDVSKKVNVPFNFRTPEQWKQIFESYGMEQIYFEKLGIDQPTVPEYHTFHVFRKV
jgi:ubiquinone/menaquinone biosynthesis C-methylase UbiE